MDRVDLGGAGQGGRHVGQGAVHVGGRRPGAARSGVRRHHVTQALQWVVCGAMDKSDRPWHFACFRRLRFNVLSSFLLLNCPLS